MLAYRGSRHASRFLPRFGRRRGICPLRVFLTGALVILALVLLSCTDEPSADEALSAGAAGPLSREASPVFSWLDSLRQADALPDSIRLQLEFRLPKRHYKPGEQIDFQVRLTNSGSDSLPIYHAVNPFHALVFQDSQLVYPDPPAFQHSETATYVTIAPGETYHLEKQPEAFPPAAQIQEPGRYQARVMGQLSFSGEYFEHLGREAMSREAAKEYVLLSGPVEFVIR